MTNKGNPLSPRPHQVRFTELHQLAYTNTSSF